MRMRLLLLLRPFIGAVLYVIVLVLTIIATMPSSLQKIKDVDAKYMEAHGITEAE